MAKHLSLEEVKELQITMLKEFDYFCRKHNITYYLAYGTLLGAIRHKGYIPWDDDIDVMVPRDQIDRLKNLFKSERYKLIDVDNAVSHYFPFPRLIDTWTFSKKGIKATSCGVNIDVYIIDAMPDDMVELERFRRRIRKIQKKRLFLIRVSNKLYQYLPIKSFPFIKYYTKKYDAELRKYDYKRASLVHVMDVFHEPLKKEWFQNSVEVEFEGLKMMAPDGWHDILTRFYGDYMKLPPEEDRHPYHGTENIFLK